MNALKEKLSSWFKSLNPRERRLLALMGAVLAVALVWQLGIAWPKNSLHTAATQKTAALAQWEQVQGLRAQALALRERSQTAAPDRAAMERALEAASANLGASGKRAQVQALPSGFSVTFEKVSPEQFAAWLQQVRLQARLLPQSTDVQRAADGTWSGRVVLGGAGE